MPRRRMAGSPRGPPSVFWRLVSGSFSASAMAGADGSRRHQHLGTSTSVHICTAWNSWGGPIRLNLAQNEQIESKCGREGMDSFGGTAVALNVAALSLISAIALCVACNVGAKLEKEQSSGKTSHGTTGSLPRTQSDAETKRLYEKLEPEDREYDVFITHSQKTGQDQAGKLMLLLKNAGLRVWYDM